MGKYIMALDAGTTSNRCILFDKEGNIVSMAQKEFRQFFPNPGWVEHDANEIWSTQLGVAVEAMSMVNAKACDIAAIGITNQRDSYCLEQGDRRACIQCYCMAVQTYIRHSRCFEEKGT